MQPSDLQALPGGGTERMVPEVASARALALGQALAKRWPEQTAEEHRAFRLWSKRQRFWLDDHGLFMALRRRHGLRPWWEWSPELVRRSRRALAAAATQERQ
ncbi:MAG: 4-alpha-glucanotransferase, partial [Cyanobium sp.]